ncbi:unnamed protein product, partial [Brenthis ino]
MQSAETASADRLRNDNAEGRALPRRTAGLRSTPDSTVEGQRDCGRDPAALPPYRPTARLLAALCSRTVATAGFKYTWG